MKPITVAPGIYEYSTRYGVRASVGSGKNKLQHAEESFPLATARPALVAAWHRQKMKLKDQQAKNGGPVVRGLVSGDIVRYLKLVEPIDGVVNEETLTKRLHQERTQQLAWWGARFGDRRRADITGLELEEALKALRRAASTRNKYRQAFSALWSRLDPSAPNPFSAFPAAEEPKPKPRDVPYEFIDLMLAYIRPRGRGHKPSQTQAFLFVEAYTPVTRAQAQRMVRADVNWATGVITRPERHKGEGQPAMIVQLTPEGLKAFQLFDAADCWGKTPQRSSIWRILTAARDKAVAQLERDRPDLDLTRARVMSPYALRHSFATFVTNNADPRVAQKLLGHADFKTTEGYIQSAMPKLVADASAGIADAFAARPKAEPVMPAQGVQKAPRKLARAGRR